MNHKILFFVSFLCLLRNGMEQQYCDCQLICCIFPINGSRCCLCPSLTGNSCSINEGFQIVKTFCSTNSTPTTSGTTWELENEVTLERLYNICSASPPSSIQTTSSQTTSSASDEPASSLTPSLPTYHPPIDHMTSFTFTDATTESIRQYINEISRVLDLLDQGCNPDINCRATLVRRISSIEDDIKSIAISMEIRNLTQDKFEEQDFELHVDQEPCGQEAEVMIGGFSLRYYPPGLDCSYYLLAASNLQIASIAGEQLNDKSANLDLQGGPRDYVIVLDDVPYLSVNAFEKNTFNVLGGELEFVWMGNYQTTLIEKVFPLIYPSDGRVIVNSFAPQCSFIDENMESFSNRGCRLVNSNPGHAVHCFCSHTTVFAILLSLRVVEIPPGVEISSYVTESMSVIFLILTLSTLLFYKDQMKSDRTMIQINLSASLLLLHITSLLHDLLLSTETGCEAAAVATHLFLLSSAAWMSVEGMRLYAGTSPRVLRYGPRHIARRRAFFLLFAWGIPVCIVVVSASVGWDLGIYMRVSPIYQALLNSTQKPNARKYDICWLDQETPLYYVTVTTPIALMLLFNLIITCKVFSTVIRLNKYSSRKGNHLRKGINQIKSTLKALFILIFVLGLPWAIGYLTSLVVVTASVAMMYVNTILNGLQGVFIFVLYCLLNPTLKARIESSHSLSTDLKS